MHENEPTTAHHRHLYCKALCVVAILCVLGVTIYKITKTEEPKPKPSKEELYQIQQVKVKQIYGDGDPTKPHILLSRSSHGYVGIGPYSTLIDCDRAIKQLEVQSGYKSTLVCTSTVSKQDYK